MHNIIRQIHVKPTSKEMKSYSIDLDGKNLIITGNNGSGKTLFLRKLFNNLESLIIETGVINLEEIKIKLSNEERRLAEMKPGDVLYTHRINSKNKFQLQLDNINEFNVELYDASEFKVNYHQRNSVIRFFEATRQASIYSDGKISSLDTLQDEYNKFKYQNDSGIFFERYLVTIWNYALLKRGLGLEQEASEVEEWVSVINNDLKELFEDESLSLSFDVVTLRIYVKQDGKEKYRLDQLSSGFSSILSIYADLLMRVELGNNQRENISGVVLIDEIDAHLHVTLQKKVFSFFKNAFPKVQFIISTHSPFVVQSVSDAVIFNLSTFEQMEDLSSYSYTSIIKGLLGEKSTSSLLEEKLEKLSEIIKAEDFDDVDYFELMDDLEPNMHEMDSEAQAIMLAAKNKFIEKQQR